MQLSDAELYPGQSYSTSHNACIVFFSGGGPYDGKSGLFDHDKFSDHYLISGGFMYQYTKVGPRHYSFVKKEPLQCQR